MKRILSAFLTLCLIAGLLLAVQMPAAAEEYTFDCYTYTVTDGKATITDVDTSISGDITIPSTLGGYPVASIGYNAFYNCTNLTCVTIPDSVTRIVSSAFEGCSSMITVTISDGVTSIGEDAFYNCSSLTSVTIPDSVVSIGAYAFLNCSSLTDVYITDLAQWCKIIFNRSFANPLYYAGNLYLNGELVTDMVIPDGVTGIEDYAFTGCSSLASVTIPDSVTSIGSSSFDGCTNLSGIWVDEDNPAYSSDSRGVLFNKEKSVLINVPNAIKGEYIIPNSVTELGAYAFNDCRSLNKVTIPESITSIESSVFDGCDSLQYNHYDNAKYIGSVDNSYYALIVYEDSSDTSCEIHPDTKIITAGAFWSCSITSVTIPDGITKISRAAFGVCKSLTNVTIPDSVTVIEDSAFAECWELSSITIPNSVTSIGNSAFFHTRLTSIIIPDSVTNIGEYAFEGCNLTEITVYDSIQSVGFYAFGDRYNFSMNIYGNGEYIGNDSNPYVVMIGTVDSSVTSYEIHPDTKVISYHASSYCRNLTSISVPDGVAGISDYAFTGCSNLTSVTIPDSVTTIEYSAFSNCNALETVYYAGTEEQWKAIAVANKNEDLLNAEIIYNYKPVEPEYGEVDGWNLILKEDIGVNFQVEFTEEIKADANAYVEVKVAEETRKISVSSAMDGFTVDVAPAQMTEQIQICIVSGDGMRDEIGTYYVTDYADAILTGDYNYQTKMMVRYILSYGAAAQKYFGYNEDKLANEGISCALAEVPTTAASTVGVTGKADGVSFYGASLRYDNKIAVRYYFTGDVTGCTFTANGNTYTPVAKDGMYYVEIADILPQNLDQQIILTVTDTSGNILSVTYGPMNYIVRMNEKGSAELKNLMKALYNYHLAAKALA